MKKIPVVAAWIENPRGEILLTQRPPGKAHAGCYEFPGGKIEAGESPEQALRRELQEELGITAERFSPLSRITHVYPELGIEIDLQLLRVERFSGQASGLENQALRWAWPAKAHRFPLAELDRKLAMRHALSQRYLITPEPPAQNDLIARKAWLHQLEKSVAAGNRLVLLRVKPHPLEAQRALAVLARDLVHHQGGEILLHDELELCQEWRFGGVVLSARKLAQLSKRAKVRPLPKELYVSASCHSLEEIRQAQALECDFVTLSPVRVTPTHPDQPSMGWDAFGQIASEVRELPIFALGGVTVSDLPHALRQGAFGVAGIRDFWQP